VRLGFLAAAIPLAAACQASAPPAPGGDAVALYQSAGSKQCERGGKSLDALSQELASSGVQVIAASCAHDGRMYAQACGTPDGRILVVRVSQGQVAAATRLGLKPLRELPESRPVTCR
jgi:hypothetical protein